MDDARIDVIVSFIIDDQFASFGQNYLNLLHFRSK